MINTFIAISYEMLYDDVASFNVVAMMSGIPSASALKFITERQQRAIHAFSNKKAQNDLSLEMRNILR